MNFTKIALSLLAKINTRTILADVDSGFDAILNKKLVELAANNGVELNPNENLVGAAMDAAKRSGAQGHEQIRDVAMDAIHRVITRNPSDGGFKELAKDYARNTVLVSIVLDLKSKGMSMDDVKKDSRVLELCQHFNIRPSTVEKYYSGAVKPNREINDLGMIGLRNTKQRSHVFEEFKKEHGSTFNSFWYSVLRHEALNIVAEYGKEMNKALNDAMKIVPEREQGEDGYSPGTVSEAILGDEDAKTNVTESKMMARKLKDELKKLNPDYVTILKLMNDNHLDVTKRTDYKYFMKAFGMADEAAFLRLQKSFLSDLKRAFSTLDISDFSEAHEVMKYARVRKVLAAAEAVYGKFLLRLTR
jgi:hypothetical protein